MNTQQNATDTTTKPYAVIGAGPLVSFLYKSGSERAGWIYRFNVFRHTSKTGRTSQLFRPEDLENFAKLTQVLAFEIAQDGCLNPETRDHLSCLASCIDMVLPNHHAWRDSHGPTMWQVAEAIRALSRFLRDERHHTLRSHPSAIHVFEHLQVLEHWLNHDEVQDDTSPEKKTNADGPYKDSGVRLNAPQKDDPDPAT